MKEGERRGEGDRRGRRRRRRSRRRRRRSRRRRRRRVTNRGRSFETNEIPFRSERRMESARRKASRRRSTLARMRTTLSERSLTSHAINLEEKRRFAKCGTALRVPSRCIEGRVGPHSSRNPLPPLASRVRRASVPTRSLVSPIGRTKRGVKVDDFVESKREKESRFLPSPCLSFLFPKVDNPRLATCTRLRIVFRINR